MGMLAASIHLTAYGQKFPLHQYTQNSIDPWVHPLRNGTLQPLGQRLVTDTVRQLSNLETPPEQLHISISIPTWRQPSSFWLRVERARNQFKNLVSRVVFSPHASLDRAQAKFRNSLAATALDKFAASERLRRSALHLATRAMEGAEEQERYYVAGTAARLIGLVHVYSEGDGVIDAYNRAIELHKRAYEKYARNGPCEERTTLTIALLKDYTHLGDAALDKALSTPIGRKEGLELALRSYNRAIEQINKLKRLAMDGKLHLPFLRVLFNDEMEWIWGGGYFSAVNNPLQDVERIESRMVSKANAIRTKLRVLED